MKEVFIVTGGFFDGSSEGYIGKVFLLRSKSKKISLRFEVSIITEPPTPSLRVKNKGFAGGSIYNNHLWLCSSNQVLAYSLPDFELTQVIDDPLFNDLHYVLPEKDGLFVVNTGLESLDYFNYDGKLINRTLLTSDERTIQRTSAVPDFRVIDSKPHFMHANYCFRKDDGHMLLTLVRQRRIVDTGNWGWASPEYSASPHEGFIAYYAPINKDCLWVTTVPGEIIASDIVTGEIIKKWDLKNSQIAPGWTRGLYILVDGFLVGVTKIRSSNAGYYSGWGKEDVENSRTTVSYIPFENKLPTVSIDVLNDRNSKVFSILSADKSMQL
ncbi:hypothetical protein WNY81_12050 [Shewanella frigidimarina]|uniref:hypothetical protein n=1 Tax=Shewanella frigidimarina TaxID=56812 RepID=UPI00317F0F4B